MHRPPVRRLAALALGVLAAVALAADPPLPRPGPRDKCPVCGMFVARYPDWTAAVVHRDGATSWFDGAKDMFRYLQDPKRYAPGRSAADVQRVLVTDYYAVKPVDAREAWFVAGADVYGPMGNELVPFARREDAEEFLRDHKGTRILRFGEVDAALLGRMD